MLIYFSMKWIAAIALVLMLALLGQAAEAGGRDKWCKGRGGSDACDSARPYFPTDSPRWRGGGDQDRARDASRAGEVLPLETILRSVRKRYHGKLLDADLVRSGSGYVYLIKIIDDSDRVRILQVDARSGRVLGAR